jgi:TRAP-type C4-dicarboxylate transport system permease small subunit
MAYVNTAAGDLHPLRATSASPTPAVAPAAAVPGWQRALLATERWTTRLAASSAGLALTVAAVAGLWQVAVRFVFNAPSEWSEVTSRFALIWMVYMGLSLTIREGAMVSIDLLHRTLQGRWQRALEALIFACTLALLGVLVWQGAQVAWRIRFQEVAGLGFSMSWAYLAIPTGALFASLATAAHFFDPRRQELENAV